MNAEERPQAARGEAEEGTRDPAEIRDDIERARGEVGDTVAAIAAKSDVKGQAKEKVAEVKDEAGTKAGQVARLARENPVPAAILGTVLALLVFRRLRSR